MGWTQVFGLGFVSVFDQVLEGLPEGEKGKLFSAYLDALGEDSTQYRQVICLPCHDGCTLNTSRYVLGLLCKRH